MPMVALVVGAAVDSVGAESPRRWMPRFGVMDRQMRGLCGRGQFAQVLVGVGNRQR